MAFKQKNHKIKFSQELKTLDEIHNEKLNKFNETNNIIELNKKKIILLKKKLSNEIDLNNDMIEKIKKKISLIENENIKLENTYDELDYFDKTKDILLQYFENKNNEEEIPNEIEIENNHNEDNKEESEEIEYIENQSDNLEEDKIDNIVERFNLLNKLNSEKNKKKLPPKKRHQKQPIEKKSILKFLSEDISGNVIDKPIKTILNEKGTLRDQYLSLVDSAYACNKVKLSPIKMCKVCNQELTLMQSEGIFLCQSCGEFNSIIIESEIPSHKDSLNEKRKYPYNPINHLIEKLNQFQAKQTTKIPQNIYDIIKKEVKKNMLEINEITPEIIQDILKKYKLELYYEHHYLIFSHITETPPPSLTRDDEDDVKKKFKMTELPFKLFKPDMRNNYHSYSCVLHKIFLIKAEEDNNPQMLINAKYFKLLKSRDKLKKFDIIWRKTCKYNGWPFHSSF
jgi:hypothetical protein